MLWHAFVPDSRQLERANSLLKLPGLITHDLSLCQKPCWCRARFPLCVCECVLSPSPIMSLSSSLSFLAPQRGPPIAENRSTTHRTHRTYRGILGKRRCRICCSFSFRRRCPRDRDRDREICCSPPAPILSYFGFISFKALKLCVARLESDSSYSFESLLCGHETALLAFITASDCQVA
jgi:hypothetical protein